jgi:hypothetical protein
VYHGDCFEHRRIDDVWFGELRVSFLHRSIEQILGPLIASGLVLERFCEPRPEADARQRDMVSRANATHVVAVWERMPLFIAVRARRPA